LVNPWATSRATASSESVIAAQPVKIYPDAAHGFLFQHHAEFATDVDAFLDGPG